MQCPFCANPDTKVTETREADEEVTRRRRECLRCEKRFTTYERVELNLMVIKKNGSRTAFDRTKVKNGFVKACEKRPISQERIEQAVDEIETKLRNKGKSEISSHDIGEEVMKSLKRLDQVAYVRFASVYREFTDLSSFQNELKSLMVKKNSGQKNGKRRRERS
ncbi:MAG: transcriptional regulator NrdR [Nanoarchaeota archaeon]